MRTKIILLVIFSLLFLYGCTANQTTDNQTQVTCNAPYIRFGTSCCLDQNNNQICDTDENTPAKKPPPKTNTQPQTSMPTESPPATTNDLSYSKGTCPTLKNGENDNFASDGLQRRFVLNLPSNPSGAPVLFVWHGSGGSPTNALNIKNRMMIGRENIIFVAPYASGNSPLEWFSDAPAENNADLLLFDDILACLHTQYAIDLNRIWTTGFSAGAGWSSYLVVNRANRLASAVILSGGLATPDLYKTPAAKIPVLIEWGGPTDIAGVHNNEQASLSFSQQLQDDGNFVIECKGNQGHTVGSDIRYTWTFLRDHPKGGTLENYANGLPSEFPSYCK